MSGDAVLIARDVRVAVGRLARQLRRLYGQGQAPGESSFLELAVLLRVERTGPSSASALATGERGRHRRSAWRWPGCGAAA